MVPGNEESNVPSESSEEDFAMEEASNQKNL